MSEIERVIKRLGNAMPLMNHCVSVKASDVKLAIQALQEKAEREKLQVECEYCSDSDYVDGDDCDYLNLELENNILNLCDGNNLMGTFTINYCPMCGRKLVEE